jgi:hypothetical protein
MRRRAEAAEAELVRLTAGTAADRKRKALDHAESLGLVEAAAAGLIETAERLRSERDACLRSSAKVSRDADGWTWRDHNGAVRRAPGEAEALRRALGSVRRAAGLDRGDDASTSGEGSSTP